MKCDNLDEAPIQMIMHYLVHLSKYQAILLQESFGLKPSQAGVLFTLSSHGKLSQRELAEKIGVKPPSMTVMLRKMEDMGYIRKEPDSNDQRIVRIIITEKGSGCIDKTKEAVRKLEEIMFRGITAQEQMLLRRILIQMKHNLTDSREFKEMNIGTLMNKMRSGKEKFM